MRDVDELVAYVVIGIALAVGSVGLLGILAELALSCARGGVGC